MRLAFVLRLGNQTQPASGFFEGWVEEVDTCTETRFRSTEELLQFLGQRFDLTMDKNRPGTRRDTRPWVRDSRPRTLAPMRTLLASDTEQP